ncbi:unnamed protein product [Lactuca saligna]|uniref:Uncharacterized protein n=1 Tax=Lactuca saligna TaxID=75948 RepID=A0AA35VK23_LACSI|nr:unnamed protein product [Lactuca saligna]
MTKITSAQIWSLVLHEVYNQADIQVPKEAEVAQFSHLHIPKFALYDPFIFHVVGYIPDVMFNLVAIDKDVTTKTVFEKSRKGSYKNLTNVVTEKTTKDGFDMEVIFFSCEGEWNSTSAIDTSIVTPPPLLSPPPTLIIKPTIVLVVSPTFQEFNPKEQDVHENGIMSGKQYKILNSKLNTILQFLNDNAGKPSRNRALIEDLHACNKVYPGKLKLKKEANVKMFASIKTSLTGFQESLLKFELLITSIYEYQISSMVSSVESCLKSKLDLILDLVIVLATNTPCFSANVSQRGERGLVYRKILKKLQELELERLRQLNNIMRIRSNDPSSLNKRDPNNVW